MNNSNPLSEHSISALDVPSQKEWYKQQIGLYYEKCLELTKKIKEAQRDFMSRVWKNNYLTFQAMQLQGKAKADKLKEWRKDYAEVQNSYSFMSVLMTSLYLSQRILGELKTENAKLYKKECI